MFFVVEIKDVIYVKPHLHGKDRLESAVHILNRKYANKVLCGIGLCISLFDITKITDLSISDKDGSACSEVRFRCAAFRPFQGEILIGKVKRCTQEGIQISLGFFDDITAPSALLPHPSQFDQEEQTWVWAYKADENDESHNLYFDIGEEIRFAVVQDHFTDISPQAAVTAKVEPNDADDTASAKKSPYTITASVSEPGLGLLSWWQS
ncbi:DNA-directed RNA polymerase III subunit RPC8-like [Oscarella lobularis]|uniref:DNA-directed RNA polymerase III subunit RPC8-like n=1 Tax=Oscarella lobularis TaxID=121494 RepID=UPI0033136BEB